MAGDVWRQRPPKLLAFGKFWRPDLQLWATGYALPFRFVDAGPDGKPLLYDAPA